jgi:4-hydroxy-3-methylbut-2-en-1-yl diphosphate synthase IspG/GcpE
MKKTIIKSAVAIHLLLLLLAGATTQAQTNEKPLSEMKVAGTLKNEPVYEINVNNTFPGTYTIVISDENGIPLYEETLSGNNIKRKFVLNKEELGATGVVFEVYNGRIKEAVYAVKNNRITAEHVFATAKR